MMYMLLLCSNARNVMLTANFDEDMEIENFLLLLSALSWRVPQIILHSFGAQARSSWP